jgi:hypothetical protein
MRTPARLVGSALAILLPTLAPAGPADSPYIRVVEVEDRALRLDIAIRTLVADDPALPLLHLVGAIHIADAPYYAHLQSFLDIHDVVLYEGVGGGHETQEVPLSDHAEQVRTTAQRLTFLAMLGEAMAVEGLPRPANAEDLAGAFGGSLRPLVRAAATDAWGRPVEITADPFDVRSLGADGLPGGEDHDADLSGVALLANPKAIDPDPRAGGLQRDLADALGLTFQLDGIDYSNAHWRNSDLDLFQIREALGGEPAERGTGGAPADAEDAPDDPRVEAAEALFETLSGESFLAKASGVLLRIVGATPQGRALVKVMLTETLTQADALLGAQQGMMGDLMKVIIDDRNEAVVRDLRALVEDEPDVRTVAIFYGAGHFTDLEARIAERLGYTHQTTIWVPAITVDLQAAGLTSRQLNAYRAMMRRMIETQLKANQPKR